MKQIKSSKDIQDLALDIVKYEAREAEIAEEFTKMIEASNLFEEYQTIKENIKSFRTQFDEAAKKFLKQTGQKTSEGPAGRITLVKRNYYSVEDKDSLPEEYKDLPDLEAKVKQMNKDIKRDFEILHKEVPGIKHKITESITWTKPKDIKELENVSS